MNNILQARNGIRFAQVCYAVLCALALAAVIRGELVAGAVALGTAIFFDPSGSPSPWRERPTWVHLWFGIHLACVALLALAATLILT